MSTLRIKIELNRGGDGAPWDQLMEVSKETEKFLRYLAQDFGIAIARQDWVARNFENHSVMFDAETGQAFSTDQLKAFTSGFFSVTDIDAESPKIMSPVQHRTVAQFAKIGEALPPAQSVGLGIYKLDDAEPTWRGLSHKKAVTLREKIDQTVIYTGSIQGRVHSLTIEGEKWFHLRANRHSKLIRCDYPDYLYPKVHEATKDSEGFVTVRGRITTRTIDRDIAHIAVVNIRPNPVMSDDRYRQFFGADPKYTGELSTEDAVDDARSSDA